MRNFQYWFLNALSSESLYFACLFIFWNRICKNDTFKWLVQNLNKLVFWVKNKKKFNFPFISGSTTKFLLFGISWFINSQFNKKKKISQNDKILLLKIIYRKKNGSFYNGDQFLENPLHLFIYNFFLFYYYLLLRTFISFLKKKFSFPKASSLSRVSITHI